MSSTQIDSAAHRFGMSVTEGQQCYRVWEKALAFVRDATSTNAGESTFQTNPFALSHQARRLSDALVTFRATIMMGDVNQLTAAKKLAKILGEGPELYRVHTGHIIRHRKGMTGLTAESALRSNLPRFPAARQLALELMRLLDTLAPETAQQAEQICTEWLEAYATSPANPPNTKSPRD
jgi:hypothetical protein